MSKDYRVVDGYRAYMEGFSEGIDPVGPALPPPPAALDDVLAELRQQTLLLRYITDELRLLREHGRD